MGTALVSCRCGCHCEPARIDAHRPTAPGGRGESVFAVRHIRISNASGTCVLRVRILHETSSGNHKFKLSGLTLSVV